MKKAEVRKPLLEMVEQVVYQYDFTKYKTSEGWNYKKNTEYGYNEVIPFINQHGTLFFVSLAFVIRISEIQQVINPFLSVSLDGYEDFPTLACGITSFGNFKDNSIKAETPEELESALKTLKGVLENEGMQFFESFKTVDDLDKELNRDNRPRDLYCSESRTPNIGLSSAVLNGNKQARYWEKYYRDKLRNMNEHLKKQYEALVLYLNEHYKW